MITNYKMIVQYKGTKFNGWQKQNQGNQRTVQGVLEKKLSKFFNKKIEIIGAGRTDKGAHALGQVANFTVDSKVPKKDIDKKIRKLFFDDIYIVSLEEVELDFHSRYDAKGKHYNYKIVTGDCRNPIISDTHYYIKGKLDIDKMLLASKKLIGEKDFKSFMAGGSSVSDTVRELYNIEISRKNNFVDIDFYGNGFLYKMVRIMVGLLIDISNNKIFEDKIDEIIEGKDRKVLEHTAPAHGLYLMKVFY